MTTLHFTKGYATGSDFLIIADPDGAMTLAPHEIAWLCDRKHGVGADGVIRAVRSAASAKGQAALAEDPAAEWFMEIWRPDGNPAPLNGHALRVFTRFLIESGFVAPERRDTVLIGTQVGVKDVLAGVSGFSVDLGRWKLDRSDTDAGLAMSIGGSGFLVFPATASVPAEPADSDAPADPAERTVVRVAPEDPLEKNGVARIRVTGSVEPAAPVDGLEAVAAALAFRHWGGAAMPHSWSVETPGGRLAVRMYPTEEGEHVSLSGPANLVFVAEVDRLAIPRVPHE